MNMFRIALPGFGKKRNHFQFKLFFFKSEFRGEIALSCLICNIEKTIWVGYYMTRCQLAEMYLGVNYMKAHWAVILLFYNKVTGFYYIHLWL